MLLIIILLGVIVILLGIFKQVTKMRLGYQLANLPGYMVALIGLILIIVGIVLG